MPRKANDISRAGAIEGVMCRFAEDRPKGAPPKPFWLTYTGNDVVTIPDVGLFQNGTTAEVDRAIADRQRGQKDWVVRERPKIELDPKDVDE